MFSCCFELLHVASGGSLSAVSCHPACATTDVQARAACLRPHATPRRLSHTTVPLTPRARAAQANIWQLQFHAPPTVLEHVHHDLATDERLLRHQVSKARELPRVRQWRVVHHYEGKAQRAAAAAFSELAAAERAQLVRQVARLERLAAQTLMEADDACSSEVLQRIVDARRAASDSAPPARGVVATENPQIHLREVEVEAALAASARGGVAEAEAAAGAQPPEGVGAIAGIEPPENTNAGGDSAEAGMAALGLQPDLARRWRAVQERLTARRAELAQYTREFVEDVDRLRDMVASGGARTPMRTLREKLERLQGELGGGLDRSAPNVVRGVDAAAAGGELDEASRGGAIVGEHEGRGLSSTPRSRAGDQRQGVPFANVDRGGSGGGR